MPPENSARASAAQGGNQPRSIVGATRELLRARAELLAQLRYAPAVTAALVVLEVATAAVPIVSALGLGWLVTRIEGVDASPTTGWHGLLGPLALVSAMFIVQEIVVAVGGAVRFAAAGRIDRSVRSEVRMAALERLSIAQLEDPDTADDLARASDIGEGMVRSPGSAATGQLRLVFRIVAATGAAVLLGIVLSPLLAAALFALALCIRTLIRRQWMGMADAWDARERHRRRSVYWTELGRDPEAGKDIRMFGLGSWLVARRTASVMEYLGPLWPLRRRVEMEQVPVLVLTTIAGVLAILVPGLALRANAITAAELFVCLGAGWAILYLSAMGLEAFDIEHGMASVAAAVRLRALAATAEAGAGPARFATAIRCEDVTFTYPGGDAPVFRHLDLEIGAREVVGIVGRNGIGKTTLIKLLTGIHRPDSGLITADGEDIAGFPADRWHSRTAVVFQDYVRLPATLADNIAIGASEHLRDSEGVRRAAAAAGIGDWLDDLPNGLDTIVGREFDDGVDLSGGQWQGVAIARALFAAQHGRDLVIFDEPTAHLDAHAEEAFFDRVTESIQDAAIVLISHRLGTIRHADRIVLLGPTGVIEQGSHDELTAREGEYARLFRLQATRFAATGSS